MAKQESQEWPPASGAFKGERVSWVAWQRSQVKVRWGPLGELWIGLQINPKITSQFLTAQKFPP